ncbi:MAG: FG-GAP-like repeat-containing protein [Candidatus Polarisedimenticolia bacterium]
MILRAVLHIRPMMRAAMAIAAGTVLAPALAAEPGRAAFHVLNTCELQLNDDGPLTGITLARSSLLSHPPVTLTSTPGGLQALPPTTPSWSYESNQMGAFLGWSMSAGDLNGDGVEDLIVSARNFTNQEEEEGAAFMFQGSPSGLPAAPTWVYESNIAHAHLPADISIVPDVNGDGLNDLLMGSLEYSNELHEEGVAALWKGAPDGLGCRASWVIEGNGYEAYFGYTVTSAGDVNGDGYGDVMIGWADYESGMYGPGRSFVYAGGPMGLHYGPIWAVAGTQATEFLGASSAAGDVNGDGFGDLLVGAPYYDNGHFDEGGAFLYLGSASGLSPAPVWSAEGNQTGPTYFGVSLASGDVNGDGYDDMMIAAYEYDFDQNNDGAVFVYHGSASGLPASPTLVLHGSTPGFELGGGPKLGNTIATGDVNADGFDDLLVGTTLFSNGQNHEGAVFLYLGSASGLSGAPAWTAESNLSASYYGNDVALGDLNADGLDDVIVGAWGWSVGQVEEGAVFVYLTQAPSAAAGRVSEQEPLTVQSLPGGDLQLTWGSSCLPGDSDYEIYEGLLGDFSSHVPGTCTTGGLLTHQLTPSPGDRYYLVVPRNALREGSYGLRSDGTERPASASSCMPQAIVSSCPGP